MEFLQTKNICLGNLPTYCRGLRVKRRAPGLFRNLMKGLADYAGFGFNPNKNQQLVHKKPITHVKSSDSGPIRPYRSLPALDWLSLYALAVNEENAAGGRVVTAPTNGAAGTIPAVLKYYLEFVCPSPAQQDHDTIEFLLTASAIGMLYKRGASISAADMGCQGEIGVACSYVHINIEWRQQGLQLSWVER
jgi:hypothetical protein